MDKTLFRVLVNKVCKHFDPSCEGCPFYPPPSEDKERDDCLIWSTDQEKAELILATWIGGTTYLKESAKQEQKKIPETRREILQAAERCVCGERDQDYGGPEDSFALIARLWEPIIKARCVGPGADVCVDAVTVALCMAELKIARAATNETHMDSWVDLAGYAACGGEIARGREKEDKM